MVGAGSIFPERLVYHHPVWHYTDVAGLAGIVAGDPGKSGVPGNLRATAATMLNDLQELKYGVHRIEEWFERDGNGRHGGLGAHLAIRSVLGDLGKSLLANPAYVACASTEGDLLGQWRGYAGDGGYAVQLETAHEYTLAHSLSPNSAWSLAPTWVKVAYETPDQDLLIEAVFDHILDNHSVIGRLLVENDVSNAVVLVSGALSGLAAALKHPSFASEQEVRLVAFLPTGIAPLFRGSVRGVVPYVELVTAIFPNLAHPVHRFPLPIRDVRVGPAARDAMEQRSRGVRILLDSTGRTALPVNHSTIPFLP